jgi:hypothetical protein
MEKHLFDWKDWDDLDAMEFAFTNCILKVDIGSHKAGDEIPCITMNYENGTMGLYFTEEAEEADEVYPLSFNVGEKR